ncbi:MAG: hypothetical protein M3Q72_10945, partial [Actinomycetota bacterium]|nr:hypothetical protein [Actinomycetota bacterium]
MFAIRVSHGSIEEAHYARVAIDALAERLTGATDDDTSAATLYDLLVPEEMRHRFQSAPSVQLV